MWANLLETKHWFTHYNNLYFILQDVCISGTSLALRRLIISLSQYNVQILCWAKAA